MIKGCHRNVVFIKNTASEYFEEAYFVLREPNIAYGKGDAVSEASRLLFEAERKISYKKRRRMPRWENVFSFSLGIVISAVSFVLITVLF